MFIEKMKSAWPGEHIARVRRSPYFSMATLNRNLGKIVIGLPMALLIIYLVIFSRPRYLSESTVAIKSSNDISGTSLNVGLLLGAGNPGTAQDAMYLKEYINSPDMLTALDKQLDFHSVFGRSGLDFLYHLPKDASREQFLNYYRDRIAVTYDDKSGLLTIGTQGFTPQFAEQFNKAVLKESERFINEISHKIARDQQAFAENEMLEARARLNASKAQLLAYQNHNNILDP
ncbi:UNVERIFIED_ORG: BexC/CtrB/KpsE family polysaccharide export inner-membrane protein, partial [Rahnella aquatilis]